MMRRDRLKTTNICIALLLGLMATSVGCMSYLGFPGRDKETQTLEDLTKEAPDLIGKFTRPIGMKYLKIESIALVTGLDGTGEDPSPTPQRAVLMEEMKRHKTENPEQWLASPTTALVLVRAFLRPGIQKGDQFDVEVRTPTGSKTTSLRGGWVMPTQLTEVAVLGHQIRSGHELGDAWGAILVDPNASTDDDGPTATRGRVLGGGVAKLSRPLGLVIDDRSKSVRLSAQIAKSINRRFDTRVNGKLRGVANPKNDELIDIVVHVRYKDNIGRYMRVIQNIAVDETPQQRQARVQLLAQQILDPLTTAKAALQLEALGDDQAKEILQEAILSEDIEVRFYAAEALAYLDDTSAVEVLADVILKEPAFRVNAMAALSAMNNLAAFEALYKMLSVDSAETRYGAFRSLWAMNPGDPLIVGTNMNNSFSYHQLKDVGGPPMIHVTNSHRPEVVLFGEQPTLKLPMYVEAGSGIMVNGLTNNQLVVSRIKTGSETEQLEIEPEVDQLIRAIVELGGTYPDVVQTLQSMKNQEVLVSRMGVDAVPQSGRKFKRDEEDTESEESDSRFDLATPLPDLFQTKS